MNAIKRLWKASEPPTKWGTNSEWSVALDENYFAFEKYTPSQSLCFCKG